MRSLKFPHAIAAVVLTAMLLGVHLGAQETGKQQATKPNQGTVAAGESAVDDPTAQGLGAFGKLLPQGQKNLDVKIPSFKDGMPSSTLRAASMTRLDDENMAMEKMDIRLYGPTRERDVRVQLITALYHMPSQILASETRSRVSREDFDLQGDSMVFDTQTQQGKMVGNVRMIIHDASSLAPASKKDEGGAKAEPAPKKPSAASPAQTPAPQTPNEKK